MFLSVLAYIFLCVFLCGCVYVSAVVCNNDNNDDYLSLGIGEKRVFPTYLLYVVEGD